MFSRGEMTRSSSQGCHPNPKVNCGVVGMGVGVGKGEWLAMSESERMPG